MPNYNKNLKFIYEKPKKFSIIFGLYLLIIMGVIIYALTTSFYSKLNLKAIVYNKEIVVTSTIENVKIITDSKYYKINGIKNNVNILEYSDVYNNGQINLQDVTLESLKNVKENQVVDITFYYNKDLTIKKILKGVFK